MSADNVPALDLAALFRLRLAVARFGEMDGARWWNTQGILGPRGDAVISRGLPRTHSFAQARIVFAVARARCEEVFSAPGSVTLWHLTPEIEDEFEVHWQDWLDTAAAWTDIFEAVSEPPSDDLAGFLSSRMLITAEQAEAASSLTPTYGGRAVDLGAVAEISTDLVAQLALGFTTGAPGQLAVPFALLEPAK